MDVLTISLGRNILKRGSREYERMRGYAKYLNEFHIVVLTRREHRYKEEVHEGNLHIYPTNSRSRILMLVDAFLITRNIARQQRSPSLTISAQDPLEIGWLCWFLSWTRNTRLHVQVHGDYFSSNGWVGESLTRRLRRRAALVLLRLAPRIRVVSERIKTSLVEWGVPNEKITTLPIRPELEQFLNVEAAAHSDIHFTFLTVCRFSPEKNIARMVEAFQVVHTTYPEARLRLVGKGEEEKKIRAFVHKLSLAECVDIIPWTDDVPSEMARADVFLLASLHEAYALTLVEAMAVGLPLITTDVGCVGEVVVDGEQGIVVHEDTVRAYAAAMERMLKDVTFRKSCSAHGHKTAQMLAGVSPDVYAHAWVTALT